MLNPLIGIIASSGVAASTTAYESIATTTVGAGGVASITFSSIPSTYTHLQIRGIGRSTTSGTGTDYLQVQFNADTASNYAYHDLTGDGSAASAAAGTTQSTIRTGLLPRSSQLANSFGVAVIDILDYANTSKAKTLRSLCGMDYNTGTAPVGQINLRSGLWTSTSAITSIKLYSEANNLAQYSSFALYGIKGA
jgi:hypothetical protein